MSLKIDCYKCKKELNELGALIFSPPKRLRFVEKFHICKNCYDNLIKGKSD